MQGQNCAALTRFLSCFSCLLVALTIAWRNTNFAVSKAIEIADFTIDQFEAAQILCTIAISFVPGTSGPCQIPAHVGRLIFEILFLTLSLAIDVSEKIYSEIVDGQNGNFEDDRQQSIYENVITNHANIRVVFAASQQLKVMLGEISEGLREEEEEEELRRRLTADCISTSDGFQADCSKPSCEDPARICDGSFNFNYTAYLKGGKRRQWTLGLDLLRVLSNPCICSWVR